MHNNYKVSFFLFACLGQLEIHLEEVQDEGLLVSWAFRDRPDLKLSVSPRLQPREVSKGRLLLLSQIHETRERCLRGGTHD